MHNLIALPFSRLFSGIACLLLTCLLLTGGIAASASAGNLYQWVDEKGVVHFSERPPANTQAEVITTRLRKSPKPDSTASSSAEASDSTASEAATTASSAGNSLRDPNRCSHEQKRLTQLQSGARIRMNDGNGGFYFLTPEQIQREIQTANTAIQESCAP